MIAVAKEGLTFSELDKRAKERALESFRERSWDYFESDSLTEWFKEELKAKGFVEPEVCWGLSYTQGDGVAFWGSLDIPKTLKANKIKGFAALIPFAQRDVLSAKVTHHGNYCHWNSMSVEIEFREEEPEDFLPQTLRHEWYDYYERREAAFSAYNRAVYNVQQQIWAPVRRWERRMEEFREKFGGGPNEWMPTRPDESPKPLELPMPEKPVVTMSRRLQEALVRSKARIDAASGLVKKLEEALKEWVQDTSRELEKAGYAEIEYRSSDEVLIETIEANDYRFDEDGGRL